MSMQDPISDMLTRIRNGQMAGKIQVAVPKSKLKVSILKVLSSEGYIDGFDCEEAVKSDITVKLKYFQGAPVINKIKRVSSPGLRVYKSSKDVPEAMSGLGVVVVSTPSGVMTGKSAKKAGVGGEVLLWVA